MVERKTINAVLGFAVAWAVLFGLPFAIPMLVWPQNLVVGAIVTIAIFILAILYFESGNKARLEVTINRQRQVAHAGDTPYPLPLPNILQALFHGLWLKALSDCRLPQPKVLLNGLGSPYMSWNWMPQQMVRGQFLELTKGQEVFFPLLAQVWIRPEIPDRGFQPEHYLILNTDPPISRPFAQLKEPFIDFDVEFIRSNTKPYRFRLNAQSWDDINLVFRD